MSDTEDKELFEQATAPPEVEPATEEKSDRVRDEQGRFARQEAETPAEPSAEAPAEKPEQQDHRVPLRELLDEREKRQSIERRYETEMREFQRQQAQMQAYLRQAQEPKEKPDIYVDPDAYLDHRVNPIRQELAREIQGIKDGLSRTVAVDKHGEEAINAAYAELERQMRAGSGDLDYARIMRSAHPYGELVRWHQQLRTKQTVGDDPEAWYQKRLAADLADPVKQAKILEELQGNVRGNGARGPNVQLPPSLNRVAAASSRVDDAGDMSDASLFRQATR